MELLPVIPEVDESKCVLLKKEWFIKDNGQAIHAKYQIQPKPIAEGAFGVVFKARMRSNKHVMRAVKRIDIPKALNDVSINRIIKQIDFMKQLDHPNLVKLYETYQTQKHIYMVMEYCGGGDLFDRVEKKGKLSQFVAKNIFRDIAKVIKYLHSRNVCHRDLKLQNFMFSGDSSQNPDMLKLIDFGLSTAVQENASMKLKSFVGTAYYLSPEVLNQEYGINCDVWSMGIMLIMMLTGKIPFKGIRQKQLFACIKNKQVVIPEEASYLVKDLLAKMLTDQKSRLSASQILQHPWLIDTRKKKYIHKKVNLHALKNFAQFNPLKKIFLSIIASQVNSKDIKHLSKLFKALDTDNDGFLSFKQIINGVDKKQLKNYNEEQLQQIISGLDTDKSGTISYTQFLAALMNKSVYMTSQNSFENRYGFAKFSKMEKPQYLRLAFDLVDKDGNGTIQFEELKELMRVNSGVNSIQQKQWQNMIKEVDTKKDGVLSFDEFEYILCS